MNDVTCHNFLWNGFHDIHDKMVIWQLWSQIRNVKVTDTTLHITPLSIDPRHTNFVVLYSLQDVLGLECLRGQKFRSWSWPWIPKSWSWLWEENLGLGVKVLHHLISMANIKILKSHMMHIWLTVSKYYHLKYFSLKSRSRPWNKTFAMVLFDGKYQLY